ncbi:hypothetical protein ABFX02_01G061600 [Erythranthe guttata]
MPKSSRHKSHKQSKHSSRDYSDSEEDVIKMKEKSSSKDENSIRVHRDSASGDKRKVSSSAREGKDSKDLSGHGNGDVLEEYVSSKRRKEKTDVVIVADRWSGGVEERGDSDRNVEKENHKGDILKVDLKLKETSSKGESLRVESRSKSKRHDSGIVGERKDDSVASVVLEKEEGKSKGESKRRSERDSSSRKDGKDTKEKDRRSDKEKNGGQESKIADAEVMKLVDMDLGKKQVPQLVDFSEDRLGKRARDNTERTLRDESRKPELEKEIEKKARKKREASSEKEKHYDDSKEGDERRLSSKGDRSKDLKYRDDKHKDGGGYADKYPEDDLKDDRRKEEKYKEESGKDNKHHEDKYLEDDDKDVRRRDDRHREDVDRESRRKDEKHREDGGERDSRRKEDKYREAIERESRRDDKYHEDGERDSSRRRDERYHEDGDKDDRRRDSSYRDDGDRDNRHKEEKYREDVERDIRHNDSSKQGDGYDREKRPRDTKYRDERASRDRSGEKSDLKRSREDGYADHHARKSSAYDDSPTRDDRVARYRDDQGRRRTNEKEDYGDKSRGTKDQRSDSEKKSASSARMDIAVDRVRSTSRNADVELSSSHSKRRSSPTSSFHAPRDHYRAPKQDESKYRDHNYEERNRHSMTSSRDYAGAVGGSEKPSSRSGEKLGQKDDGHFGELSAERRLKSDMRSSPLKLVDNHKSPSSSDRRPFGRPDVRRSTDVDESMQRSGGGSRDWKDYPGEELSQADADNTSSPFVRNNHYSNSSKALPPPPPYRTSLDSPSVLGSGEDDGRGKPNMRHRRMGDPNMGRMQGNAWRGVPSWPSPVANGFLPYPHGPHPVGFHTVMQPFPSPQMFVRPSMDLSHASPYHMPDADRFSGPGRPMGWRNQVDDSCPPLSGWETSNAVFGDDSHIYGRPEWEHSRNLSVSRGWESSADLWKGQNRTSSMEALSSEKENNSIRSGEGALAVQPVQPAENEQSRGVNQQTDSTDVDQSTKSFGKNDVEASLVSAEDGVAKMSRMDDLPICHVYLSKLDISTDLTEPELFDKCRGLMDVEHSMFSDIDDSKILYMEDVEARMVSSHRLLSYALFASTDDSVFQKSISLYKRQKGQFSAEGGEETEVLGEMVPNSAQEEDDIMEEDQTENLCPTDAMQGIEENDALPDFDIEIKPTNDLQNTEAYAEPSEQMIDPPLDQITVKTEEPDSDKDKEEKAEGSETTNNEETKLVDSKFGPLLSSDDVVSSEASEAMMPESMVAGSVNLSRIHHSPESTH